MSDRLILSFRGEASLKEDLLARIAAAEIEQGKFSGTADALANVWAELKQSSDSYGFLPSLALLFDRLVTIEKSRGSCVGGLMKRWFESIPVGADLGHVPTQVAIWLLNNSRSDTLSDNIGNRILALHMRDAQGNPAPRRQWAEQRAAVLAAGDAPTSGGLRHKLRLRLWEAAAWPARSSRSILLSMADSWAALAIAEADPDWSDEDEARKDTLLYGLRDEFAALREMGEQIDYPSHFRERDPELEARFVKHLDHVNGQNGQHWHRLADHCMSLMASTEPASMPAL